MPGKLKGQAAVEHQRERARRGQAASARVRRHQRDLQAERLVAVGAVIVAEVRLRWREGPIPAGEGGALFRALSDRTGYPECILADLARAAGVWPWRARDVVIAVADRVGDGPPDLGPE